MTDILDAVAKHRDTLHTESKRKTFHRSLVIAHLIENIRVHTARAEDLKPSFSPLDIDLDARFGEKNEGENGSWSENRTVRARKGGAHL